MELKDSLKKFGKRAALAGMLGAAVIFTAGCDADEDEGCCHKNAVAGEVTAATCTEKGYTSYHCPDCGADYKKYIAPLGHNYGDWEYDVEPSEDVIGKKHQSCSRCDSVVSEDDPSKFVSHKCGGSKCIIDNDGYIRADVNDDGKDNDYNEEDCSGDECSYNKKAIDSTDKTHYGKKHQHYIGNDDKDYILWDMNGDGDFFDDADVKDGPFQFKTKSGKILN